MIYKALNPSAIAQHIRRVNWDVGSLLTKDSPRTQEISEQTIDKLVKLSGLSYDKQEYPKLISALKEQVRFVDHLHDASEVVPYTEGIQGERLDLQQLEELVRVQRQDGDKGEIAGSWDPMSLPTEKQNGHYIVREGLVRK